MLIVVPTENVPLHPLLVESPESPLGDVRVWRAQIDSCSPKQFDELRAHLDSEENARAARFKFVRDQKNYIVTRGLLRSLLGALLNQDPAKLRFEYGARGKPRLASGSSSLVLRFNISHSNGWAMFAISDAVEVGIDLESMARLKRTEDDLIHLAARILSPNELAVWEALPDSASRPKAFLRAWTRKEAYAKATGLGIFHDLSSIELVLDGAAPRSSLRLHSGRETEHESGWWILQDLSAPEGFAAALAFAEG